MYRLSSLLSYYIPRDDDLQYYRDFIDTLPFVDSPEAFGQHFNAEMASLMEVNRTVCETLLIFQGQSSSVDEDNKEENVLNLSSKILSQLPELIDYDATAKNIGIKRNPLDVVLLQEVFLTKNYFNILNNEYINLTVKLIFLIFNLIKTRYYIVYCIQIFIIIFVDLPI